MRLLVALSCLAVLAASASAAHTGRGLGCVPEDTINGSTFDYVLCELPDLDQVRQQTATTPGLPGDGYNYCAPTATMDALAYFAGHGAPTLRPGDKDWTDPANYNEMSQDIHDLGDLMGTTASGGTTGGYFAGLDAWLGETQPGVSPPPIQMVAGYLWATSPGTSVYAPTLQQMADDGAAGNVVIPNIVFMQYETPPEPATGPKQWLTVGGHVVTMSSAHSPSTIGLHDPAEPIADHDYQSPYAEETYTVTPVTSTFGYIDGNGNDVNFTATLLRVDDYALNDLFGDGTQAYIWGYTILQPEHVSTWSIKEQQVAVVRPGDPVERFATEGPVVDLVLDPTRAHDFYVAEGSPVVWDLDLGSGESVPFAEVGTQPDVIAFAGRAHTLFAARGGRLAAFDGNGRPVAATSLGETVDALAVDQATSRLFALSADSRRLRVLNASLDVLASLTLPRRALAGSGKVSLALNSGVVYIHRDGMPLVALLTSATERADVAPSVDAHLIELRGSRRARGLAVDDSGHMFVQSAGQLAEYRPSGELLRGSPFNGQQVGPSLAVDRNFSSDNRASMHFVDFLPFGARR
jgi:hypothetical protein